MIGTQRVVAIMAKGPIAGRAKTRLIPLLGPEQAAGLYRQMLLDTVDLVAEALDGRGAISIVCPTTADQVVLQQLVPAWAQVIAHERGDLMAGLNFGLAYHTGHGCDQVILLDGDSPTLPADYLRAAFDALAEAQVVLGPTLDGGYYLIGACQPQPALFSWERLDGATVCRQTQARAEAGGARVALLSPWYDVDTAEDFDRLVDELGARADGAPRTRRFLRQGGHL